MQYVLNYWAACSTSTCEFSVSLYNFSCLTENSKVSGRSSVDSSLTLRLKIWDKYVLLN
jgi:hypothetical protein